MPASAPGKDPFSLHTEGSIGTLGFASPEQQAGQWDRVGPASDVFSLGATLFFLLTGDFAFKGPNTAEVAASVECGGPAAEPGQSPGSPFARGNLPQGPRGEARGPL